tara:strand:- start:4799 stop:5731 length:933 start_codon:yes stop_codon:yes gene_type:complete
MRLLLLGCTGFIGKDLIPKLLAEGHNLCVVSRKNINKFKRIEVLKKIQYLKLDLSKKSNWKNSNFIDNLRNADGIINLMGEPIADKRWSDRQKKIIEDSRISSTSYLIDNLRTFKINPKVIINASAIGFYGTSSTKEFNEASPSGNDFLANLCKKWEEAAKNKPRFTRLVIFRIGIVLEKDGGALGKMLPIFRIGLGGPIGSGNQWMSWIHKEDLCGLIMIALKNKKYNGVINAVAPESVTMREFTQTLATCLKRPNLMPVPAFPLRLLLGEGSKIVLEGQKVKSSRLKKSLYQFKYPLLENAIFASTKK